MIIVKEAGGFFGPIRKGTDPFERGEIIATNAELYEPFGKIIRQA